MKKSLAILLLFLSAVVSAQTQKSFIEEADAAYNKADYRLSVDKYREAFKIADAGRGDLYNAACSAALLGDKPQAFNWLNEAFDKGWMDIDHLKSDTDLNSLHDADEWKTLTAKMQKAVDLKEANYDKPLQAKLLAVFEDDQPIRQEYVAAQKEYGRDSKVVDSLAKVMMYKDSINLIKVTEILDTYGWVGTDKVGGKANQTLFLVIQHADLKTQQKYLPMMRDAVKKKNASGSSLALLEDRVALGEGRKQIYGSQIGYDSDTKKNYVLPLLDPDNVDIRRTEVGLGPLADYVKRWEIVWNPEQYKKELPALEEKEKSKR